MLGSLQVLVGDQDITPTAPKQRQVLALLVLRRNSIVRVDEFITELWGDNPPSSAMTTLQTYIYKLRRIFAEHGAHDLLRTSAAGYTLSIPDSATDVHRFGELVDEGKGLLADGHAEEAGARLAQALDMWTGTALMDVESGELLYAYAVRLEEVRFQALELRIDADLRTGRQIELVSELKVLVSEHPLHEWFHAALMTALHQSGRRYEALEVFRTLRANLVRQLKLEPGPEVTALHQKMLSSDSVPSPSPVGATPPDTAEPEVLTPPSQLPCDIWDFVGRAEYVEELTRRLSPDDSRTTAPLVVISGAPGCGKSALAIRAAHRLRDRFPDGQLYARLSSESGPAQPCGVLGNFLRALHVPGDEIPEGEQERVKLFRSVTVGLRILIVLDDVPDIGLLRALLPSNPHCGVIVTSRRGLHGYGGSTTLELGALTRQEGVELLAKVLGRERVERERPAAERLVDLAGALPLALRALSSRLVVMPQFPLAEMADQLVRSRTPLSELRYGDHDVRAMFDLSYESLTRSEQAAFRLLSMLPSAEFTAEMAADFLGWDLATVESALESILDHHLIEPVLSTEAQVRFGYSALARLYATERLADKFARLNPVR
ncbi:BTAD domain-containing putative transcriptional regulator [Streptomyces flaveolus]|uniref:AfsR/SARP family transcriptional regulator n=1 Tax=Streptomyces flaveolus TaxID=67297 RepID=UPI003417050B